MRCTRSVCSVNKALALNLLKVNIVEKFRARKRQLIRLASSNVVSVSRTDECVADL